MDIKRYGMLKTSKFNKSAKSVKHKKFVNSTFKKIDQIRKEYLKDVMDILFDENYKNNSNSNK